MTGSEILVTGGGVALIGVLALYFFGPKEARRAGVRGGVQEVQIDVKGGYSPNLVRVHQGVPLRLVFDRQENSDCSSRVVFPDFGINKSLVAFGRTTVELMPADVGEFDLGCRIEERVDPGSVETEDREAIERRAEIRDLSRRVIVGAILTTPVVVAVMATNLFDATWVPDWLMNRWVQLALIAPVMFYAGWPIHRTGWLTLRHRTAD